MTAATQENIDGCTACRRRCTGGRRRLSVVDDTLVLDSGAPGSLVGTTIALPFGAPT